MKNYAKIYQKGQKLRELGKHQETVIYFKYTLQVTMEDADIEINDLESTLQLHLTEM